jgi:subtilisin family serine protease
LRLGTSPKPRLAPGILGLIALGWASLSWAAPARLTLPLYDPAGGQTSVPAYAAQKFEIKLGAAPVSVDRTRVATTARTGRPSVDALLDQFGVRALEPEFAGTKDPNLSSYYIVHLPAGSILADAVGAFRTTPGVEAADPIAILPVTSIPNDSLFQYQYGFYQANDRDSDLPEAWDLTQGDSSVVLAIVDTGVLWSHPDLAANIWRNWGEIPNNGIDDDGNGYIDDVRGWDFVTGVVGTPGEDVNTPDNDPSDYAGHGTAVAGVAGAVVNNVSGVAGAGYHCRIMPVRAGWETSTGSVVDMSFCAQAITYATDNGANVINCSWQNADQGGLGAAVTYAIAHGVTVVVAAGNEGTDTPPQNDLGQRGDCVDVAALDANDVRTTVSNFGAWVDVSAAGDNIITTGSAHYTPIYTSPGGTSFAAPLVTGVIGLWQSWRKAHGLPLAPPDSVRWRLHDTADNVDSVNPTYAGKLGGGRVNAYRMITDPPTSFFVASSANISYSSPALVDWGSGPESIVYGDDNGNLYAVNGATGSVLPGWPVALGNGAVLTPAVWDVDFDGAPEVLVGDQGGELHAVKSSGAEVAGWPKSFGGAIAAGPALGNVSGTPEFEIVFATRAPQALHVIDRSGAELTGWPKVFKNPNGIALGDLDHDSVSEIVLSSDSTVQVLRGDGTPFPGWPVHLSGIAGKPAIGDFDGDGQPDIVVGSSDGLFYAFNLGGVMLPGFPLSAGGAAVQGAPALADIDGDGKLEAIVGAANGNLYAWHGNGTAVTGWPRTLGGNIVGSPAISAVTGDGTIEIAAVTTTGSAHLLRADGSEVPGWPRDASGYTEGGATLGDPDKDGRAEFLATAGHLSCWDLGPGTFDSSRRPWYTAGRSFLRESNVTVPTIDVGPPPSGPRHLAFVAGANPLRLGDALHFGARGQPGAKLDIGLFDVGGRRLAAGEIVFGSEGSASWAPAARSLQAGVYFVAARSEGERISQKVVLLP